VRHAPTRNRAGTPDWSRNSAPIQLASSDIERPITHLMPVLSLVPVRAGRVDMRARDPVLTQPIPGSWTMVSNRRGKNDDLWLSDVKSTR
jgi:hypothetical protein